MGMWPTATLTYGYDITSSADWTEDDDPEEAAGRVLVAAGDFHDDIGIVDNYADGSRRLVGAFLQASGWRDKGRADSLELPEGIGDQLRRAADALGIDLGDSKPYWLLTAKFD